MKQIHTYIHTNTDIQNGARRGAGNRRLAPRVCIQLYMCNIHIHAYAYTYTQEHTARS